MAMSAPRSPYETAWQKWNYGGGASRGEPMPRIEDYPDTAIDVQMAQDGAQEMPYRTSDAYGTEDGSGAYDAGGAYRSGPRMEAYGSEAGSGAYGTGGAYNSE